MSETTEPSLAGAATAANEPEAQASEAATIVAAEPEATEPEGGEVAALRREAAERRRQLRAAEAERDALREQVDRRDRADAERLAGETMASAGDLWVGGVQLTDLRGEDGALSPELVEQAVGRVLAERPHWRRPSSGMDGGARMTAPVNDGPSFGEALKGAGGAA